MSESLVLSPFHRGEHEVQSRLGVRDKIEDTGQRFIRSYLPDQHREFYQQLPYLFVGSVDQAGRPWASVLIGQPGFIQTPDEHTLRIVAPRIHGDPLTANLTVGGAIGVLGIQYETRRRNRLTAQIASYDEQAIVLNVRQTFGNCPQYIQARQPTLLADIDHVGEKQAKQDLKVLTQDAQAIINKADNFYIASYYMENADDLAQGADVSHRGGRPGFVRIEDDHTFIFPDFTGNYHFNTIGNLIVNPQAGLLFIDFDSGDLLSLTCTAEIIWDSDEKRAFTGAERLVRFTLVDGILIENAVPINWQFIDYSPSLDQTGTWQATAATLAARRESNTFHTYTVTRVERESTAITSFYLKPEDAGPIQCHKAGQFLPLELDVPECDKPLKRTYTISNAPNGAYYRLSIKRELAAGPDLPPGLSSNYFHDHVKAGSTIRALAPRGQFTLATSSVRSVVLLSAGVGITPMLSMLEQLAKESGSCGCSRQIWFIHGARSSKEHAFADEIRALARDWPCLHTHIAYSTPTADDIEGVHYDSQGRIDIALLKRLLPFDDYDFYLCGPPTFMQSLYQGLKQLNISDQRMHYEFFGPGATLLQDTPGTRIGLVGELENQAAVNVHFAKSDRQILWEPAKGTLLDLAEDHGLRPAYSCRSGICGTCATRVIAGDVAYLEPPLAELEAGDALICCSYPDQTKAESDELVLDL